MFCDMRFFADLHLTPHYDIGPSKSKARRRGSEYLPLGLTLMEYCDGVFTERGKGVAAGTFRN